MDRQDLARMGAELSGTHLECALRDALARHTRGQTGIEMSKPGQVPTSALGYSHWPSLELPL